MPAPGTGAAFDSMFFVNKIRATTKDDLKKPFIWWYVSIRISAEGGETTRTLVDNMTSLVGMRGGSFERLETGFVVPSTEVLILSKRPVRAS